MSSVIVEESFVHVNGHRVLADVYRAFEDYLRDNLNALTRYAARFTHGRRGAAEDLVLATRQSWDLAIRIHSQVSFLFMLVLQLIHKYEGVLDVAVIKNAADSSRFWREMVSVYCDALCGSLEIYFASSTPHIRFTIN